MKDNAHPPESVSRCANPGGTYLWIIHTTLVSASHHKIPPKPLQRSGWPLITMAMKHWAVLAISDKLFHFDLPLYNDLLCSSPVHIINKKHQFPQNRFRLPNSHLTLHVYALPPDARPLWACSFSASSFSRQTQASFSSSNHT